VDRESFRSGVKLLALARWTLTCVGRDSRCWWVPGWVWIGSDPDRAAGIRVGAAAGKPKNPDRVGEALSH